MANTLKVKIITLSKVIVEENIQKIFTRTPSGSLEILPGHAPIIISTESCITSMVRSDGNKVEMFTSKGILSLKNNEITLCCDATELSDEIDLERAIASKERAERRLKDPSKYDIERAKLALNRALLRIDFKEHSK